MYKFRDTIDLLRFKENVPNIQYFVQDVTCSLNRDGYKVHREQYHEEVTQNKTIRSNSISFYDCLFLWI
jgi:hypothetical protein